MRMDMNSVLTTEHGETTFGIFWDSGAVTYSSSGPRWIDWVMSWIIRPEMRKSGCKQTESMMIDSMLIRDTYPHKHEWFKKRRLAQVYTSMIDCMHI